MCRLGRTAGSAAEMSDLHCGVPGFVDGGRRGDARRDAPATYAGGLVPGLDALARHPVGRGTAESNAKKTGRESPSRHDKHQTRGFEVSRSPS
jgi:hypothetical protein